jgi:hypothetical protein
MTGIVVTVARPSLLTAGNPSTKGMVMIMEIIMGTDMETGKEMEMDMETEDINDTQQFKSLKDRPAESGRFFIPLKGKNSPNTISPNSFIFAPKG